MSKQNLMIEDYAFINIGSKRVIVQIKELRKNKQIMDLTKILKNAPIGIELYSLIHGSLTLHNIKEIGSDLRWREIICKDIYNKCVDFLYNCYYSKKYQDGSCILYPSSNNYCWNNWQTILFKKEKSIGHVINKIIDDSLPTDEERYIITPNLKCIDIYGKEHDLSDIDILNFEFSDKLNESLFFSQLNLNGYIYNNTEHKLITVDKNQCIHQISDGINDLDRTGPERSIIIICTTSQNSSYMWCKSFYNALVIPGLKFWSWLLIETVKKGIAYLLIIIKLCSAVREFIEVCLLQWRVIQEL